MCDSVSISALPTGDYGATAEGDLPSFEQGARSQLRAVLSGVFSQQHRPEWTLHVTGILYVVH